ncbi:MAG: hypothetical protein WKF84_30850 [Pyrinomonadaceae bacterium]
MLIFGSRNRDPKRPQSNSHIHRERVRVVEVTDSQFGKALLFIFALFDLRRAVG